MIRTKGDVWPLFPGNLQNDVALDIPSIIDVTPLNGKRFKKKQKILHSKSPFARDFFVFRAITNKSLKTMKDFKKRLEGKIAVVYGDGSVGGVIAKAFAREGAQVFLTGRTLAKLDAIAAEMVSAGDLVETAILDALDEQAVDEHMRNVVDKTGKVDISFNAIGIPQKGIQGIALTELSVERFFLPVTIYTQSHFITAKAAARRMIEQKQGVIIMHTPNASRVSPPFVGGMVPAWAAMEALCRSLSVECGQFGVRAVCLHTTGIPETSLIDEVWDIHGKAHGVTFEQFHAGMEGLTHRRRLTKLEELTSAAVFVASDEGAAITGTTLNLTAGMIV
jgi:NAD(P)-dependent dehydrogenase (short-subunit alcohol dehydrogenase family)